MLKNVLLGAALAALIAGPALAEYKNVPDATAAATYSTVVVIDPTTGLATASGGGGGTQYTEDAAAAANPVGNALVGIRRDTLDNAEVSADGDNVALKATKRGELQALSRTLSFSTACVQMTSPGTGGTYAVNDLVANNATAGSVTPISCAIGSYSGASIRITKAQLLTSTTTLTNASFLIHLYTSSPTVANGNDGAYSSTASGWFCTIPVTLGLAFSNGAAGQGTPSFGGDCARVLSSTATVYALIQANATYAWTAAMTWDLTLEGLE